MSGYWTFNGGTDAVYPDAAMSAEARECARRVVVIDPEDTDAVRRLTGLFWASMDPDCIHPDAVYMGDALREFATPAPPKPAEPQGLGAVVEDTDGKLWIRTVLPANEDDVYRKPWSDGPVRRNWHIVDAVRVLSEGVTP